MKPAPFEYHRPASLSETFDLLDRYGEDGRVLAGGRGLVPSFQEDDMGVRDRALIGADLLVWGSDYPHTESTFPRSRTILERILEGVPREEPRQITRQNAARLYRFDTVPVGRRMG
jgi:Amidohydrolase